MTIALHQSIDLQYVDRISEPGRKVVFEENSYAIHESIG